MMIGTNSSGFGETSCLSTMHSVGVI